MQGQKLATDLIQERSGTRVAVETHFIVVVDISGSMSETWQSDAFMNRELLPQYA